VKVSGGETPLFVYFLKSIIGGSSKKWIEKIPKKYPFPPVKHLREENDKRETEAKGKKIMREDLCFGFAGQTI